MSRKILIFSPLPPIPSGIANYTHALAQELTGLGYEITVVVNQNYIAVTPRYKVCHWKQLLYHQMRKEAVIIYQVGNNVLHEYMFPFLFSEPGIMVLHDFILGHGRLDSVRHTLTPEERRNELVYELGIEAGENLAHIMELGVSGHQLPFAAKLNKAVLEASIHTIVHNPDTCRAIQMQNPMVSVEYFPMGIWERNVWDPVRPGRIARTRRKLGANSRTVILGTFGVVNPYKQIDVLLEVHKELYEQGCQVLFLIVGYQSPETELSRMITGLGLQNSVKVISNAKKEEYWDLVRASDVCYSLRFPPAGEFSLSVMELMASRRVVVINQHRFNNYLSERICLKVRNAHQKEDLLAKTKTLYESPDIRTEIGLRASEYARFLFSMKTMINNYVRMIEAYPDYKRDWEDRRMDLPPHLRPINDRVLQETLGRFARLLPEPVLSEIRDALI
jgi:glycosyltransferase involved in cell wall biosynthesis